MNVELVKSYQFEAAHRTSWSRGGVTSIHGHSFRVDIVVEGPCDPVLGWLIDYGDISTVFDPLYNQLDHKFLNETPGMDDPSLRGVRAWILDRLKPVLPGLKDIRVEIAGDGHFNAELLPAELDGPHRLKFTFEAAHFLPNLPASHKCRYLHGHSFRIEMAMKKGASVMSDLHAIYDALDHRCLNDIAGLENPTSEMVSQWIWCTFEKAAQTPIEVIVAETCTARCIYRGQ